MRRTSDQAAVKHDVALADTLFDVTNGKRFLDPRNDFRDFFVIVPRQTVNEHADIRGRIIRRRRGLHDNVRRTEALDLFLRFLTDPFTDRQKPNDARNPNKNTHHRQQ